MSQQPIITLLSDLGTRDAAPAMAKALLLQHVPGAVLVDISHYVAQYDLQQAAYLLLSAYKHFPKGTIHLVLVDVFAGAAPRMLLTEKDGFYFIAPDNGVLPLAFGASITNTRLCRQFDKPYTFKDWITTASTLIATIQQSNGSLPYEPCDIKSLPSPLRPNATHLGIECTILYIDRYENIVLDITRAQFNELVQGRPFKIKILRLQDITTVSNNYSDVPNGEPLCRFNSAGFLEIALNHDKAASLLGLSGINTGNLRYHGIRIFF